MLVSAEVVTKAFGGDAEFEINPFVMRARRRLAYAVGRAEHERMRRKVPPSLEALVRDARREGEHLPPESLRALGLGPQGQSPSRAFEAWVLGQPPFTDDRLDRPPVPVAGSPDRQLRFPKIH
jgi:hypothetical protein